MSGKSPFLPALIRCDRVMKVALRRQSSDGGSKGLFEGTDELKREKWRSRLWLREYIHESVQVPLNYTVCVTAWLSGDIWPISLTRRPHLHMLFLFSEVHSWCCLSFSFFKNLIYSISFSAVSHISVEPVAVLGRLGFSASRAVMLVCLPADWNMPGVWLCCLTDDTRCQSADLWPL